MNKSIQVKVETEPIFRRIESYSEQLSRHPLLAAARDGQLPSSIVREIALQQYSDSILWIPMLAQMKTKAVRSARLRRAIEDNIACEAGLGAVSHVQLAVNMMRSLGASDDELAAAIPGDSFVGSALLWLSDEFAQMSEPELAGWLLAAETLVPVFFAGVLPCFTSHAGCDVKYFVEHVSVDDDEHAKWMAESVDDVAAMYGADCIDQIVRGVDDAWRETVEVPDQLWAKLLQQQRAA